MVFLIAVLLFVAALIRAVWISVKERFRLGLVGGVLRLAVAAMSVLLWAEHLRPEEAPDHFAVAPLVSTVVGPVLSAVVLFSAWRRYQNVPAAEEDKAERPFGAWLPVGVLDAMWTVAQVGTALLATKTLAG